MRAWLLALAFLVPTAGAAVEPAQVAGIPPPAIEIPFAGEYFVHRPGDVEAALHRLAAEHPDLATLEPVGTSVLEDELWVVTIADPAAGARYHAYLDGGHHAGEHLGVELTMAFLAWLVEGHTAQDARALAILADYRISAMPMVNPDGNYASTRTNANGVNLNRNYPFMWGVEPGSSGDPTNGNYRGPSALSEPESRANWEHVNATRPDVWITMHTGIAEMYWPWGYTGDKAPDWRMFESLELPFENATNGRLDAKQGFELYPVTGANDDSGYAIFGIPGYTIEVHEEGNNPAFPGGIAPEIADQLRGLIWLVETAKWHGANVRAVVDGASVRLLNDGWGEARNVTLRLEAPGEAPTIRTVTVPARGSTVVDLADAPGARVSGEYRRLLIDSSPVWNLTIEGSGTVAAGSAIPALALPTAAAIACAVAIARRRYV